MFREIPNSGDTVAMLVEGVVGRHQQPDLRGRVLRRGAAAVPEKTEVILAQKEVDGRYIVAVPIARSDPADSPMRLKMTRG